MDLLKLLRAHWDRAGAVAALVSGVVALALGYAGVSRTPFTAEQIPYIVSGAVAGVFLLGVAATLYLSADLRDEWRKLDDVDERLARLEERIPAASAEAPPSNGHAKRRRVATR